MAKWEMSMAEDHPEITEGIKTFFIEPDRSMMPLDFLSDFFLEGYEAYYLLENRYLDVIEKVHALFSVFSDLIIFFNTEQELKVNNWPLIVRVLQGEYKEKARFGVLYSKHIGPQARREMESLYLYDIGINCGCIPIESRPTANLALLTGVLKANQANGRRKNLRAICRKNCTFAFLYDQVKFSGTILDVSVSHFSCTFASLEPSLLMYGKSTEIHLNLGGTIVSVCAMLLTKRVSGEEAIYIFVFKTSQGEDGLDSDVLAKVNKFIYEHYERNVNSKVKKAFEEEILKKTNAK